MTNSSGTLSGLRFGAFEFQPNTGELRKHGLRVKLRGQPIEVLTLLLERAGDTVTREELQRRLWPADTFVDFEHSLNAAMKRLRAGLGDSADTPLFIETLSGKGYRFIAPVSQLADQSAPTATPAGPDPTPVPAPELAHRSRWRLTLGIAIGIILTAALVFTLTTRLNNAGSGKSFGPIHSLVVLPLANLSGDPQQDYFVEGMTDALRQHLETIGSLRVISRTSSMHYGGSAKPLPDIARELNVDAVVDGSVLRAGARVRINVELIQGGADRHLWSDTYEADVRDVFYGPEPGRAPNCG